MMTPLSPRRLDATLIDAYVENHQGGLLTLLPIKCLPWQPILTRGSTINFCIRIPLTNSISNIHTHLLQLQSTYSNIRIHLIPLHLLQTPIQLLQLSTLI